MVEVTKEAGVCVVCVLVALPVAAAGVGRIAARQEAEAADAVAAVVEQEDAAAAVDGQV